MTPKEVIKFVNEQKAIKTGEARLHLVQFSDDVTVTHEFLPLDQVPPLTTEHYRPHGNTALLDAIGSTITGIGACLNAMAEEDRPEQVVFVIMTDGEENASRAVTKDQAAQMIKHQTEVYKWDFIFLGANFDAIKGGGALGIQATTSMTYQNNRGGILRSLGAVSQNIGVYRQTKLKTNLAFTPDQRQD